ncbi:hypothetical protein [Virgibacillus doumboii]|uniref:hypothetical protein n=1 Tax=Virgibacillus doumboii TaxID=2697503 RepID=UPI0013DFBBE6|nr:hypothetical protein [Virgibacillus doumboii]
MERITKQDTAANDNQVNKHGIYLGMMKPDDADQVKHLTVQLTFMTEQIDSLTKQREELSSKQNQLLRHCINYLESSIAPSIHPDKDSIMIDENNHTWVIYHRSGE